MERRRSLVWILWSFAPNLLWNIHDWPYCLAFNTHKWRQMREAALARHDCWLRTSGIFWLQHHAIFIDTICRDFAEPLSLYFLITRSQMMPFCVRPSTFHPENQRPPSVAVCNDENIFYSKSFSVATELLLAEESDVGDESQLSRPWNVKHLLCTASWWGYLMRPRGIKKKVCSKLHTSILNAVLSAQVCEACWHWRAYENAVYYSHIRNSSKIECGTMDTCMSVMQREWHAG